jgi:hypothetical protein
VSKIILHIGTHKTASTTIQDMFWENSARLEAHGVIYPRLSRHTGHHGLVPGWTGMPNAYKLPGGGLPALKKIARDHAGSDRTVFLSSEEFSRERAIVEMAPIRDVLSAFDEIEVICAVRVQWQFLQSIYLEMSKKRAMPRPAALVKSVTTSSHYGGLWLDYTRLLTSLEALFAPEEITFFDFDTMRRADGGVIGTLLRHLDIPLAAHELKPVNNGASNVSPLPLASWAANILSEPKVATPELVALATKAVQQEAGKDVRSCVFTRAEFDLLRDYFSDRNAEFAERRKAVQPGFVISQAQAQDLTLFRNDIRSTFWVELARLLVQSGAAGGAK